MPLLTVADFERAARQRLDPVHFDFFAGGAGDEITMRANTTAFGELTLLPRVLRGNQRQDTSLTLLGARCSMPIVFSPTAFHRLAHPDGEQAAARAAEANGIVMIVSMAATTSIEQIAAAAPRAVLWFQLYIQSDLAFTQHVVRRAEAAGCKALVVTVDSVAFGIRYRDRRNGFDDLPPGLRCENMRDAAGAVRPIEMFSALAWEHIDWLRGVTSLPVVLKGVLHPLDAVSAVEHGVDALMVSNHGGRQLDTVRATVDLLPEIVAAVEGRVPVLVDSGVRRGTDVVKALALGADAVGVGRPVVWGLAVDGERGVRGVVAALREELENTLALCGTGSLSELGPELVSARRRGV